MTHDDRKKAFAGLDPVLKKYQRHPRFVAFADNYLGREEFLGVQIPDPPVPPEVRKAKAKAEADAEAEAARVAAESWDAIPALPRDESLRAVQRDLVRAQVAEEKSPAVGPAEAAE